VCVDQFPTVCRARDAWSWIEANIAGTEVRCFLYTGSRIVKKHQ
jgi:hypothetical protein